MPVADPSRPPRDIFMYTLRPTRLAIVTEGPTEAERQLAGRHWVYSQELLSRQIVVFAGRVMTGDDPVAMVVIRADTEEAARSIMEADPAVAGGLFQAKLHSYQPMLMGEWPSGLNQLG